MVERRWFATKRIRYIAIGLIAILLLAYIGLNVWFELPPKISRQIDIGKGQLETVWIRDITLWFQSSNWVSNTVYAFTTTEELLAVNSRTGSILWQRHLPQDELGVRGLFATDRAIYTVTATEIHAYDALTGELVWSTRLGDGHVMLDFQAEDALLRVYYGNRIIELSPETGQVLSNQPRGDIEWITNNIEIHHALPDQGAVMVGIDHKTGKSLWTNNGPMFVRSERFPIQSIDSTIFVQTSDLGICGLNLISGKYLWCRTEEYISNMSLNRDENAGYVIRSDFSLVKIDLSTGKDLAEIGFSPKELPAPMQNRGFEYSTAYTQDAIVVSFGDSDQTFGLVLPR